MRRAASITVRKSSEANVASLRCGETVLGRLVNLREGVSEADGMTARFENAPAFADHRELLKALADALKEGAADSTAVARLRDEIEALGIHVHHDIHAMRIDESRSLVLAGGEVRFKPTGAFLMLRSGGLG